MSSATSICDAPSRRRMPPGTVVEVRSWEEIARTLDDNGRVDGLPFMPEMLQFCGMRFRIRKRLERTCEESEGGMRRIQNVVFLDQLRCDGSAHGGCQKGCMIFWRDEWLREATGECIPSGNAGAGFLYSTVTPEGQYVCQSTELIRATTQLHALDLRMYVRDIRANSYSVWGLIRILGYAWYLRLRRYAIGKSYRVVEGGQGATPVAVLDLRPGELVLVKTPEKISATLDRNGKNRGLAFTVEMISFCGKVFRVLRRVERTIHDRTGRMIELENTVILDGVTCDGCHILRGGCLRETFHFWREAWLERVGGEGVDSQAAGGLADCVQDARSDDAQCQAD